MASVKQIQDDFDRTLPPEHRGSAFACIDPSRVGPRLFFQRVPEGKVAKNRLHLDVRVGTGARSGLIRLSEGAEASAAGRRGLLRLPDCYLDPHHADLDRQWHAGQVRLDSARPGTRAAY